MGGVINRVGLQNVDVAAPIRVGILGHLLKRSCFIPHDPEYGVVWVAGILLEELELIMRIPLVSFLDLVEQPPTRVAW
ncbi:hypothetical protein L209DRAFT_754341 [Thermothelomyces heterothallicus CBS 203.75]